MSGGSALYSSYDPSSANSVPSYQEIQPGGSGRTLSGEIDRTATLNVPFDQLQWENSKQNWCIPPTCTPLPVWPPPFGTGFVYPTLEKNDQPTLMGEEKGCFQMAAPFVDQKPVLPSIQIPGEEINGKVYSPHEILNMYDCMNTPQPMNNQCFGYMPYDSSYQSSSLGQLGRYDGWLDPPLSPVPITQKTQPLAVGQNIPSNNPSDRNPMQKKSQPIPQEFPLSPPLMTEIPMPGEDGLPGVQGLGGAQNNFQQASNHEQPSFQNMAGPMGSVLGAMPNDLGNMNNTVESFSNQPMKDTIIKSPTPLVQISGTDSLQTTTRNIPSEFFSSNDTGARPTSQVTPQPTPQPTPQLTPQLYPNTINTFNTPNTTGTMNSPEMLVVIQPGSCSRDRDEEDNRATCQAETEVCAYSLDIDTFFPCMIKSVRNGLHELLYKNKPLYSDRDSTHDRLIQQNRLFYISIFVIMIISLHFVIHIMLSGVNIVTANRVIYFYWITVFVFIVYLGLPGTGQKTNTNVHVSKREQKHEMQKITALVILGLIVWAFCMY